MCLTSDMLPNMCLTCAMLPNICLTCAIFARPRPRILSRYTPVNFWIEETNIKNPYTLSLSRLPRAALDLEQLGEEVDGEGAPGGRYTPVNFGSEQTNMRKPHTLCLCWVVGLQTNIRTPHTLCLSQIAAGGARP